MNFHISNIITSFRVIYSILLLFCSPFSLSFMMIYLTAGLTDVIDGAVARKTNTVTEFGSKFDTIADFCFLFVCLVKLLPLLTLHLWIYVWIFLIALVKLVNIIIGYKSYKKFVSVHSGLNKTVGLLLFIFPMTWNIIDANHSAIILCIIATVASVQEGYYIKIGNVF